MDLIERLECAGNLIGFLQEDSQAIIVRALTKLFNKIGKKRFVEECAVAIRRLANQVYEAKKLNKSTQADQHKTGS